MKTVRPFQFTERPEPMPSIEFPQWHPLPFILFGTIFTFFIFVGYQYRRELEKKITSGPAITQSVTQIEEERAPMKEPTIRKISTDNTAVAPSITITKAGQSLCNFVSLRDALRIAMKYKLTTYGEDSKEIVTSVAHGLALAKREKVVTIVTKGQEFLLE